MGAITLATTARNAAADAITGLVDAGAGAGYVEIRTGTPPASPQDPATGTLLVSIPLNDPAYGDAANGVCQLDVTPEPAAAAVATNTAGWARVYDDNDAAVMDGLCGTSGAFVNLASLSIVSGTTVTITGGSFTQPAA